jgi:hypothetical protein
MGSKRLDVAKIKEIAAEDEENATRSPTHPLHGVFPRHTKVGTAVAWWTALWYMYLKVKAFYGWAKEKTDQSEKFTVGISSWEESELYSVVFNWISENLDQDQKLENFLLVSGYHKRKWHVVKGSAGASTVKVTMGDVPVKVSFSEKESKENENSSSVTRRRDLIIKCGSQENVDKVTQFISDLWHRWNTTDSYEEELEAASAPRYPYYVWSGNHWFSRKFVRRDKDSVILKQGQGEDLFADVERFLSLKNEYERVNIPWHRGYLFYGPAGTGKTSLALAVASTFDIPVFSISLSTMSDNKDLLKAINAIDSDEAVLIIEDIDVASTTHSRDLDKTKDDKVALDVLLNVLDGAGTPSGLITIMTTNYIERLDDALVRPGRVDYRLLVDDLNDDQLHRMVEWYTGLKEFKLPKIESSITPADVTGAVKAFIGHPDLCLAQVRSLVESKNES